MNILYVSADSYYDEYDHIFSSDCSPENLVAFNLHLLKLVKSEGGCIDVYPKTRDINYDFIIFNDYPYPGSLKEKYLKRHLENSYSKLVLILMETPVIRSDYTKLYCDKILAKFDVLFTWNEDLLHYENSKKFNFTINLPNLTAYKSRDKIVTCIAAKKRVLHPNANYYFREKGIMAFSRSSLEFDLYGRGWDRVKLNSGGINSILNRVLSYGPRIRANDYCWRGEIRKKSEVLEKYTFNLIIENAMGYPGYITEKILHSFAYGSIPLYYGAEEAHAIFKNSGVIFGDEFDSWDHLISFLKNLDVESIAELQNDMLSFLASDKMKLFDAKSQATRVYNVLRSL